MATQREIRRPNLRAYYGRTIAPIEPEDFDFRIRNVRGGSTGTFSLDRVTTSLSWAEEEETHRGSITLQRPVIDDPKSLPVGRGQRLRLEIKAGGRWYPLWTMRVLNPETDPGTGVLTIELLDSLDVARRGQRTYEYRKPRGRSKGIRVDRLIEREARADAIPLREVARMTARVRSIKVNGSFIDLVADLLERERKETGRRFVVRVREGKLEIVPYRRNRIVAVIDSRASNVSISREGSAKPVTVIRGSGRVGKGKAAKTVKAVEPGPENEAGRRAIRRFGKSEERKNYGRVDSLADLRKQMRRDLAAKLKTNRSVSATIPLAPFVRRGDAVMVDLPEDGFDGRNAFMFVDSVSHSVGPTEAATALTVVEQDPFLRYREERETFIRAQKRKARRERKRR